MDFRSGTWPAVRRLARTLAAASAGALVLLLAAGVPAHAATPFSERGIGEPFDPARCKHGSRRHVHWAAGANVFRFRFDPAVPVYARAPQNGLDHQRVQGMDLVPPAPDPREPEGCERNPLRAGAVPYMHQHANALFRRLAGRDLAYGTADRLVHNGFFAFPERMRADDRNARNARSFTERTRCVDRAHGAVECMDAGATGTDDFRAAHFVRLPGKAVFEGSGIPPQDIFIVLARDSAPPSAGLALRAAFDLFGSVRLLESWHVQPHEVDLLVPYYRGLVRHLADAHLPGYRWRQGR